MSQRRRDNESGAVNPVKRGGRGEFGRGDDGVGTIRRQHPARFTTMHNLSRILSILLVTILAVLAQQQYDEQYPSLDLVPEYVKRSDFMDAGPTFKGLRGLRGKRMPYMNLKGLRGKRTF